MSRKIEKLLRLTADFQQFTESGHAAVQDELSEEELFHVAAAQAAPQTPESETKPTIVIGKNK